MQSLKNEVKLFMVFDILGDIVRSGMLLWHVDRNRLEDVKNHVLDLLLIARLLEKYLPENLNFELIRDYILFHDLPEAITGDITKFEGVSSKEREKVTKIAIDCLDDEFHEVINFKQLIFEYENRETIEAKVVHMIDKIQSAIPFMKYQSEGRLNIDDPRIDSNLRKHPFIVEQVKKGADLADIFYLWHSQELSFSKEECYKYEITDEQATQIIDTLKSFIDNLYELKQANKIKIDPKTFPSKAMIYRREI